jgi:23S rRNA pseudouridine1911/1915/1917 synthase
MVPGSWFGVREPGAWNAEPGTWNEEPGTFQWFMMLEILFEDEYLLAVNKPAGLVVHPAYKNVDGTLLDELRTREADTSFSLVGRLDRLTSGIVIVAKSATVHASLQKRWREADKQYLAVVTGCVEPASGSIDLPLGTDPSDRRRRMVRPDGAPSVTAFERIDYDPTSDRSLLRCRLVTGRRHQLRVHLAARGWPIVGDGLYGETLAGFPRHALHAWRLSLPHPRSGMRLTIEARMPEEFVSLYPNSDTLAR